MHMADALLSPFVGMALMVASGAALAVASRRVQADGRDHIVPLMGVLGAFVFAAQMINFTLPGTGASGHIGGGLLLSILLGPSAALVVLASVLAVQALFFADGGLLALWANVFNLGVCSCWVAYPLVYRPLLAGAGPQASQRRVGMATVLACVVGLQLGALGVVLQTWLSGISSLPLGTFLLMMQPIHLAIGLAEGLATAAVVLFVRQARPDLLTGVALSPAVTAKRAAFPKVFVIGMSLAALLTAGVLSRFASGLPDGLEWAIAHTTGQADLPVVSDHRQDTITPPPDPATSLAGVVGGILTCVLVLAIGMALRLGRRWRILRFNREPHPPRID